MPAPRIYLDHAATTPVDPAVAAAMQPFLGNAYGNPSSLHGWGKDAKKALDAARNLLADCLNTTPDALVLTSGGTESDNLAILGVAKTLETQTHKRHIMTTQIEHSAVKKSCEFLETQGWDVTCLPVDAYGLVSLETLKTSIRPDTALVSIMHGNNEIGSLQPIEAIGAYLRGQTILFHTDAVQTAGKLPVDLSRLPVDYWSMSAHKIYGPKGVGLLYIRPGAVLPTPLIFGGGQENGYRSGTENLAGIVGFSEAMKLVCAERDTETPRLRALQRYLIDAVGQAIPTAVLNGPADVDLRVPGNVHFSFPGFDGEALVLKLDLKGIAVSTGSACNSASIEPSAVVLALGQSVEIARATVRFSLGRQTTQAHLDETVAALGQILKPANHAIP